MRFKAILLFFLALVAGILIFYENYRSSVNGGGINTKSLIAIGLICFLIIFIKVNL